MDLLQKYSVMEGLGGCGIKVVAAKNLGLVWGVFFSLSLSWSFSLSWSSLSSFSSSSQSDDIGNYFGHIFPKGVHIAQYVECLENFIRDLGEAGDHVDDVSIG